MSETTGGNARSLDEFQVFVAPIFSADRVNHGRARKLRSSKVLLQLEKQS